MRKLLLALLFVAPAAFAQVTYNCVTADCTFVSDPWPAAGVQPQSCRLYNGAAVVTGRAVAGPVGAVFCSFTVRLPAGTYNLQATGVDANNEESARSNTVSFVNAAPAVIQPPQNFRKQ